MMVLNIMFLNTYSILIRKFSKVFEKKIFDIIRIKHEYQNGLNKMRTP